MYLNPQALLRVEADSARYYIEIEPSLEKKFNGSTPIYRAEMEFQQRL